MIPNRLQWCLFIQKWSLNCFGTFLSGNLPKTVWWLDFWLRKQCCWIGSASAPKPLVSTSRVNSHLIRTLLGFTTRFLTFLSGYETRKCLQDNIDNCRLLERGSGFVWEIPRQHCTPKKYSQKVEVLSFSKCPGKLSNSFWARRTSVSKFAVFLFFLWSK